MQQQISSNVVVNSQPSLCMNVDEFQLGVVTSVVALFFFCWWALICTVPAAIVGHMVSYCNNNYRYLIGPDLLQEFVYIHLLKLARVHVYLNVCMHACKNYVNHVHINHVYIKFNPWLSICCMHDCIDVHNSNFYYLVI